MAPGRHRDASGDRIAEVVAHLAVFLTAEQARAVLRVGRDRWRELQRTHPDFPKPIPGRHANFPLWYRRDVLRFAAILAAAT